MNLSWMRWQAVPSHPHVLAPIIPLVFALRASVVNKSKEAKVKATKKLEIKKVTLRNLDESMLIRWQAV